MLIILSSYRILIYLWIILWSLMYRPNMFWLILFKILLLLKEIIFLFQSFANPMTSRAFWRSDKLFIHKIIYAEWFILIILMMSYFLFCFLSFLNNTQWSPMLWRHPPYLSSSTCDGLRVLLLIVLRIIIRCLEKHWIYSGTTHTYLHRWWQLSTLISWLMSCNHRFLLVCFGLSLNWMLLFFWDNMSFINNFLKNIAI